MWQHNVYYVCVRFSNLSPMPLFLPQIRPDATLSTTSLPLCFSFHHKSVPMPLFLLQICPVCHSFYHKSVPMLLFLLQVYPSAFLSTTNLYLCHSFYHKSVPMPLFLLQICPDATLSTTNLSRYNYHKSHMDWPGIEPGPP